MAINHTAEIMDVDIEAVAKTAVWTTIAIISLPLNITCVFILRHTKDIEDATKTFLIALTLADLIFCCFRVVPSIGVAALNDGWPYGDACCVIQGVFVHVTLLAMCLSLLAVNAERYIAIAYPLKYPTMVGVRSARFTVVAAWFISALMLLFTWCESKWRPFYDAASQACFLYPYYTNKSPFTFKLYMFYIFYIPFAITVAIFALFGRILCIAHAHSRRIMAGDIPLRKRQRDTRTATTLFLMTLSQALVNVPWFIVVLIGAEKVPDAVIFTVEVLFASAGWWNIVVYYFRNRAFRLTAKRIVHKCFRTTRYNNDHGIESIASR